MILRSVSPVWNFLIRGWLSAHLYSFLSARLHPGSSSPDTRRQSRNWRRRLDIKAGPMAWNGRRLIAGDLRRWCSSAILGALAWLTAGQAFAQEPVPVTL